MQVLSEQQNRIAIYSATGKKPQDIAIAEHVPFDVVIETLNLPAVKEKKQELLNDLASSLSVRRLEGAHSLMDQIMLRLQELLNTPAKDWRLHHIKAVEILLKELPKAEATEIKKISAIQINNYTSHENNPYIKELTLYLSKMKAEDINQFWVEIIDLAKRYVRRTNQIQEIQPNQ